MSIKKFILLFVIFCSGAYLSWAQEYILPMGGNPALAGNVPENNKKSLSAISSVDLPFADDFSGRSPYPSSTLWANKYAFINDGFAVNPPTIGVATLDAIDEHGSVYATATISPETFVADSLTSLPINLAYTPADSIYLSFFYQPTGNGLQPGTYDSLCLDFYAVDSGVWNTVWAIPGDTLSAFRQVMVPIKDTIYLKDGFRFAFHNRASLPSNTDYKDKRGNVDHWNIDYVRLDKDRFRTDTVIRDVAFTSPTPSMISGYQALPWKHFKSAYNTKYLGAITFLYQNNDSADRNVTRYLSYEDIVWNETFSPGSPSTQDIFAGTSTSYSYSGIYPFDFDRGDTAIIRIKSWLKTDDFDNKVNDTLYRDQLFLDYFAYDDGSAERAYGLRGQGSNNGLIAMQFDSYITDKLEGVDLYFTQLYDSLNLGYFFKLMVWGDDNGKPGEVLYESEIDSTVNYSDEINKYIRFPFERTVTVSNKFYVGMMQYNQYMLNIGLDINNKTNGHLFYNLGEGWEISGAPGILMMRPYVKKPLTKVEENIFPGTELQVWPNPADTHLFLKAGDISLDGSTVSIYDLTGKILYRDRYTGEEISTGMLNEGIYILRLDNGQSNPLTVKFLVRR